MRSCLCTAAGRAVCVSLLAVAGAHADEFVQHPPHEHGKVTLNVVLEGKQLMIELDAPAVNVVGFEHAPRTASERAAIEEAARLLTSGKGLLGTTPEAACTFQKTELTPPRWESDSGGGEDEHAGHEHHADYEARLSYQCEAPSKLTWIEPWLLGSLRNVVEGRINLVSSAGQRSQRVGAGHVRVALP
jgi:hypothetical protein